ncbi:MAG: cold shock domain-containing protein [Candidatus Omnitrophica bacterium]|nr:cold shock domain-containing protein [Candidatus Omnitrophota bacterium]
MKSKRGSIKHYNKTKNFGFLLSEIDNKEYFFHVNDCKGFSPIEGVEVEFEEGFDKQGRAKAVKVTQVSVGVSDEEVKV